jgi:hypothetical protein
MWAQFDVDKTVSYLEAVVDDLAETKNTQRRGGKPAAKVSASSEKRRGATTRPTA